MAVTAKKTTSPAPADVEATAPPKSSARASRPRLSIVDAQPKTPVFPLNAAAFVALDNSQSNALIADHDFKIVFANKSSVEVLEAIESRLQGHSSDWKHFQAAEVVGTSLDFLFTDEPQAFRRLSDQRQQPYQGRIKAGPFVLQVRATTMKNHDETVLGYAVDWENITDKIAKEALHVKIESTLEAKEAELDLLHIKVQAQDDEAVYNAAKVEEMKQSALSTARGDLTTRISIEKEDAVGQLAISMNEMVDNLSELLAQVQIASESIVDTSTEVSAGNDDLSQRTEEQASSLEETASSMEEMTSTVKQNADSARQASVLAQATRDVAERGGLLVSSAVSSMAEINTASKRIADVIVVIDEIAFQTNLLALNAAVEAARVGEQGRGFAVVATEVRNLAGRSATAAKEVKALVQDSLQKVQQGSTLVNESGTQLTEIVGSVKKVTDIITEISAASQEQSEGIEQVNLAIMQMDQITQQNAALVEEATATSKSMTEQARDLQGLVSKFQIDPTFLSNARTLSASSASAHVAKPSAVPAKAAAPVRGAAPARAGATPAKSVSPARSATPAKSIKPRSTGGASDGFEEF